MRVFLCSLIQDLYLVVAEAVCCMVIDHAGGLHVGVDDGGADEFETSNFQVFAYFVGKRSSSWELRHFGEFVFDWFVIYEFPNVFIKASKFILYFKKLDGIVDGSFYF